MPQKHHWAEHLAMPCPACDHECRKGLRSASAATAEERVPPAGQTGEGHDAGGGFGHYLGAQARRKAGRRTPLFPRSAAFHTPVIKNAPVGRVGVPVHPGKAPATTIGIIPGGSFRPKRHCIVVSRDECPAKGCDIAVGKAAGYIRGAEYARRTDLRSDAVWPGPDQVVERVVQDSRCCILGDESERDRGEGTGRGGCKPLCPSAASGVDSVSDSLRIG